MEQKKDMSWDEDGDVIDMLIADEVLTFAVGYGRSMLRAILEQQDKLTSVQFIAMVLIRRYSPVTPSELARMMHASKQQLTQIVSALEKQGFIQGRMGQEDRRTTCYSLTEAGEQLYRDGISIFADRIRNLFRNLSDEEKKDLHQSSRSFMELLGEVVRQFG